MGNSVHNLNEDTIYYLVSGHCMFALSDADLLLRS